MRPILGLILSRLNVGITFTAHKMANVMKSIVPVYMNHMIW